MTDPSLPDLVLHRLRAEPPAGVVPIATLAADLGLPPLAIRGALALLALSGEAEPVPERIYSRGRREWVAGAPQPYDPWRATSGHTRISEGPAPDYRARGKESD